MADIVSINKQSREDADELKIVWLTSRSERKSGSNFILCSQTNAVKI